jgi:hypothetical protein
MHNYCLLRPLGVARHAWYLAGQKQDYDVQRNGCCKDTRPLRPRALGPFEQQIQFNGRRREQNRPTLTGAGAHVACIG